MVLLNFGGTILLVQKSPSSFVAFKKEFYTKNLNFNAEMLGETGPFWMYLRLFALIYVSYLLILLPELLASCCVEACSSPPKIRSAEMDQD